MCISMYTDTVASSVARYLKRPLSRNVEYRHRDLARLPTPLPSSRQTCRNLPKLVPSMPCWKPPRLWIFKRSRVTLRSRFRSISSTRTTKSTSSPGISSFVTWPNILSRSAKLWRYVCCSFTACRRLTRHASGRDSRNNSNPNRRRPAGGGVLSSCLNRESY